MGQRRKRAILVAVALVVAACGGDDDTVTADPAPDTADVTTTIVEASLADAIRIDAAVDARTGTEADFVGVTDPVPVTVGDAVRTDSTGFAEIAYFDGSVTRLDIDTEFTVIELVDTPDEAVIRTQMGIGRTWHRVQTLTGNSTYEVETSVATAVVRGTAFTITCPTDTTCTFTVIDGTIDLDLPDNTTVELDPGQELTIQTNTPPGTPTPADPTLLTTDTWLTRNNDLDQTTGNPDLTATIATWPTPQALPEGDTAFDGYFTVTGVGEAPPDMVEQLTFSDGSVVLLPYESAADALADPEGFRNNESLVRGVITCAADGCELDLSFLGSSGFKGWRIEPTRGGVEGFYLDDGSDTDRGSQATIILDDPQPLMATEDGYTVAFTGTAECGGETSSVQLDFAFGSLGEDPESGTGAIATDDVSGGLTVDPEQFGVQGEGLGICWLPSVTFEPQS